MVGGNFYHLKIGFQSEGEVNSSVLESMDKILLGVQSHLLDSLAEPGIELVPDERSPSSPSERELKHEVVLLTLFTIPEKEEVVEGLDRTEGRTRLRCKRYVVNPLLELVVLLEEDSEDDTLGAEASNILPNELSLRIQCCGVRWDEGRTTQ